MNFFIQKAFCVFAETSNKPRKVEYEDSWYLRSLKEKVLDCPSLSNNHVDADVCVVGGGLAGITAALGLAERGKKVVLIEKNLVGWGASGRNGGFALPGYQIDNYEVMERVGEQKAKQFYQETVSALHLLRKRIDNYAIECDVNDGGDVELSCFPSTEEEYKESLEYSNEKMGTNLQFWDAEQTRKVVKTDFYHHGVYSDAGFSVNPLAMTIGLGRAAISQGAKIFEKTEVLKWRKSLVINSPSMVSRKFVVETKGADGERGTVGADHIVLATNYTDSILNTKYSLATIPLYTYILVTKPLPSLEEEKEEEGKEVEGGWGQFVTKNMSICDDREALAYFRPLPGGRLLFGGLAEAYPLKDDEEITNRLMSDLHRIFPNLPEGKVEKEVVWGGRINLNRTFMPLIGQVEDGVWYCTGFAGHGVVATTVGGEVIASGIASNDKRWKLFQDAYPLSYSGWPFHKIAAMFVFKFGSLHDEYRMLKDNYVQKIKGWF